MNKTAIISGTTFVLAWVTGLLIAGGGPTPHASAADVTSYFAVHQHAAMAEHFLIDAVAGVALAGLAVTARRLSTAAFAAGLAAAIISLGQAAIGEVMAIAASGASASTVRSLFVTLNNADTVKIALLAVMIAATGLAARRRALPAWLTRASLIFAPVLAISGLAFPLGSPGLYTLLYLTLPLLLIWVAAFTIVIARRNPALSARQTSTVTG
jgi:hypothetical protein